jgi:D-alanyl-D-alanine endopeptidase (penicillin-binding protein 7)
MLHIALMSSENRAASALGRNYPGGVPVFVAAMNAKAAALGMSHTRYIEPTGLSSANVSTAGDLAKLVIEAQRQPLIRQYSTDHDYTIRQGRRATPYRNTNRLISNASWDIGLQKTGYINEAGRCMVLHATIKGRDIVMVFLDAQGKFSRAADANRIRAWLASGHRSAQR